ncbi:MAG TPA: TRAP transporter substrate-binding protein [Pararhizobium sp.]|nr:TRAP transporter substrate-binding protein [Pararhizobium sp.]
MSLSKALGIALSIAGALAATASSAQTHWTMATGYPEDSFFTENIRQFIDEIEKKTDGELTIDLRPNGTLIEHDAIKRAVRSGQVPIGEVRLAVYSNENPMYGLDNIPNLVSNYDEAWKLMEAQRPYFEKLLGQEGLRPLTYVAWPGQAFYTSEPVESLDDLQGLALRIYSPETQAMGEALGMNAIILPFAEVPQAFSTGLIEAMWTSAQTGTDIQAWDYVDHFTYTGSMHNKNAIIVNEQALQALDEETRDIVIEAGKRATERGWKLSKQANEETIEELRQHGMTIAEAPEDVMTRMREIGQAMVEDWRAEASEEEAAILDAYLASTDE